MDIALLCLAYLPTTYHMTSTCSKSCPFGQKLPTLELTSTKYGYHGLFTRAKLGPCFEKLVWYKGLLAVNLKVFFLMIFQSMSITDLYQCFEKVLQKSCKHEFLPCDCCNNGQSKRLGSMSTKLPFNLSSTAPWLHCIYMELEYHLDCFRCNPNQFQVQNGY